MEKSRKYPLFVRIYGFLCVLAGGVQIAALSLVVFSLALVMFESSSIAASLKALTITIVIGAVSLVVYAILAVMFFALGIRLLRGKRRRVALLANIMISFEVVALVCHFMLTGVGPELIPPIVNMVILVTLESYSDPSLSDERKLQRRLRQLEVKAEAEDGTLGRDITGRGYITLNFFNIFWVFVICSILGLAIEVIYHMTIIDPGVYEDRAGLLYGPFSPIYGFGAVLMTVALNRFHDKNPLLIFLVSAVIGGAFEFFVSWFMQMAFGITAWDYTGTFLSIDGRTNGKFMFMWGVLGLVWVKAALPVMLRLVNKIPWNWRYSVTTLCATLMMVDAGLTLASLDCWYQRESGTMDYADASFIEDFCNDNYDDAYMEHRFQTMDIDPQDASRIY